VIRCSASVVFFIAETILSMTAMDAGSRFFSPERAVRLFGLLWNVSSDDFLNDI
jgi:hypothetical protein